MNVAIESAHCGCERNLCKDRAWLKMCGKHNIVSKFDTHRVHSQTCLGEMGGKPS